MGGVRIRPALVLRALLAVIGLLLVCNATVIWYRHAHAGQITGLAADLMRLVDVDSEANIQTWFASADLLFASALAGLVAIVHAPDRRYWLLVSVSLGYLSLDEAAQIHEMFSFLVVYPPILSVLVVACSGFIRRLHHPTRLRVAAGGFLYCFGAIVLEYIAHHDSIPVGSVGYQMTAAAEEGFEALGAAIVVYALMAYLALQVGPTLPMSTELRVAPNNAFDATADTR